MLKNCLTCLEEFNAKKRVQKYCSVSCAGQGKTNRTSRGNCFHCEKSILLFKTGKDAVRKFCGRSCAATYNNKRFPKRAVETFCVSCSRPIYAGRSYCKDCWLVYSRAKSEAIWEQTTLKEMLASGNANKSSRYPYLRILARKKYLAANDYKCRYCGYDTYIEVCHIRAIKSFPLIATVAEVNNDSNLVGLCRNHHWELDNGLLSLDVLS